MSNGFTHESTYNESVEWYTPEYIFDALGLAFSLDPASPGAEIVPWIPAMHHYTYEDNGLIKEWTGNVFMNPPYGSDTPTWFRKLALHGNGIGLVFCRSDTKWFHEYIPMAQAICFIKGRVQFVKADDAFDYANNLHKPKGGCGAASMLVAFGEDNAKALYNCGLGLTLPVSKHLETVRTGERFAGDKADAQQPTARPYENLPQNAEAGKVLLF